MVLPILIAAGLGLAGTLIASEASKSQHQRELDLIRSQEAKQRRDIAPFKQLSNSAVSRYKRLIGDLGPEEQKKAYNEILSRGEIESERLRGEAAIDRGFTGRLYSSDRIKALSDYNKRFKDMLADRELSNIERLNRINPQSIPANDMRYQSLSSHGDRQSRLLRDELSGLQSAAARGLQPDTTSRRDQLIEDLLISQLGGNDIYSQLSKTTSGY